MMRESYCCKYLHISITIYCKAGEKGQRLSAETAELTLEIYKVCSFCFLNVLTSKSITDSNHPAG